MEYFYDYDYWQLAPALDFISWDSYPMWHRDKDETRWPATPRCTTT
jgi:beta-galactosidase